MDGQMQDVWIHGCKDAWMNAQGEKTHGYTEIRVEERMDHPISHHWAAKMQQLLQYFLQHPIKVVYVLAKKQ